MNRSNVAVVLSVMFGLAGAATLGFFLGRGLLFPEVVPPPLPQPVNDTAQWLGIVLTAEQNMVQASQNLITFFGLLLALLALAGGFAFARANRIARHAARIARKAVRDAERSSAEAKQFKDELDQARTELDKTKAQSLFDIQILRRQVLHLSIAESVRVITNQDNNREERLRELLELAQMLNPAAIRVFQFVLEYDTDPAFVTNAAYGLEQLGLLTRGPYNERLLLQHCESKHASIRESCAQCLGEVCLAEDENVIRKLRQMAESDPDPQVRSAAVEALDKIRRRG